MAGTSYTGIVYIHTTPDQLWTALTTPERSRLYFDFVEGREISPRSRTNSPPTTPLRIIEARRDDRCCRLRAVIDRRREDRVWLGRRGPGALVSTPPCAPETSGPEPAAWINKSEHAPGILA